MNPLTTDFVEGVQVFFTSRKAKSPWRGEVTRVLEGEYVQVTWNFDHSSTTFVWAARGRLAFKDNPTVRKGGETKEECFTELSDSFRLAIGGNEGDPSPSVGSFIAAELNAPSADVSLNNRSTFLTYAEGDSIELRSEIFRALGLDDDKDQDGECRISPRKVFRNGGANHIGMGS